MRWSYRPRHPDWLCRSSVLTRAFVFMPVGDALLGYDHSEVYRYWWTTVPVVFLEHSKQTSGK